MKSFCSQYLPSVSAPPSPLERTQTLFLTFRSIQGQTKTNLCFSFRAAFVPAGASPYRVLRALPRPNSKHKTDGQKASSTSLSPSANTPTAWHNGEHSQRSRNGKAGRLNHAEGEKGNDVRNLLYFAPPLPRLPTFTPHPLQRYLPLSLQMS